MGFGNCECPLPSTIPDLVAPVCAENLGQIQKIVFQRRQATAPFPTQDSVILGAAVIASWTTFLSAVDDTKLVTTAFFESFVIPGSTEILEGGDDNTTLDGKPVIVGATTSRATGMFRSMSSDVIKALKALQCELDLTVFMINEFGKIIGESPDGVVFQGIPISSLFVGDAGVEGKNTNDKANFGFSLAYGWRDDLVIVTPDDFNAKIDL